MVVNSVLKTKKEVYSLMMDAFDKNVPSANDDIEIGDEIRDQIGTRIKS